jgi:hypothetical protein
VAEKNIFPTLRETWSIPYQLNVCDLNITYVNVQQRQLIRTYLYIFFILSHAMLAQLRTFWVLPLFISILTAAPVDSSANSTQSTAFVGYVSEPNVRGTTSLVLSCLLTLVLCVWSALHLNVPQQDTSRLQRLLCNIRWIITGVYAPELVVFTAWRQWASARLLGQLVTKLSKEFRTKNPAMVPATPIAATRQQSMLSQRTLYNSASFADHRHKWTKTHDFFASTGGFAFEFPTGGRSIGTHNQPFLPKTCPTRITLTARGVAFLAKCNRLPDVPESDILDKSKANDMAKALVVIQASWMLLQTLGRLVVGLPVTLLEVNTIAHV